MIWDRFYYELNIFLIPSELKPLIFNYLRQEHKYFATYNVQGRITKAGASVPQIEYLYIYI